MFGWGIIFLIVSLVAGFLGFSGVAGSAAYFAYVVFGIGLILFVGSLLFGRR